MDEWSPAGPDISARSAPPRPWGGESPYVVVSRIPETEPYVVGIDKAKMSAVWGSVVAFTVLLWIGLISYASASIETLNPLSIMGLPALISIGANCFIWYVAVSGGPQLALNPHGLWIRARKWPVKALFLPWESVGRIYVRRAGLGDRALCVLPVDARVGSGLGAYTRYDQALQRLMTGAKLTASVRFADRPEVEILGALSHFAAGRVRLG